VWFTNFGNHGNSICRITPDLVVRMCTAELPGFPVAITKGPDGALWFAQHNSIGRIATDGDITTYAGAVPYPTHAVVTTPAGSPTT
jgi:virginiamycin B lyase